MESAGKPCSLEKGSDRLELFVHIPEIRCMKLEEFLATKPKCDGIADGCPAIGCPVLLSLGPK